MKILKKFHEAEGRERSGQVSNNAKNILVFLSAFILGGIITVIIFRNTGIFTGTDNRIPAGKSVNAKPKMKMAKGGVMVSTIQRQLYGIKVGKVKLMKLTRKITTIGCLLRRTV